MRKYIPVSENCIQESEHFNFFESQLTGRSPEDSSTSPMESFRLMFAAQVLKDASLAHRINMLYSEHPQDTFLLICSVTHMAYGHSVPERIFTRNPELKDQTLMLLSRESNEFESGLPLSK